MSKASDLRSLFGRGQRLYLHQGDIRNQPVQGVKSKMLTFQAPLCGACNNERTQPHDVAWSRLSAYLLGRSPAVKKGHILRLADVFPGSVRSSMLNVHLYFVKLFGCLITDHNIPMDIEQFSQAILQGQAHPNVHIAFHAVANKMAHRIAGHSEVQTAQLNGRISFATWFYEIGPVMANVMYAAPGERRQGLAQAWHPSSITKLLRIAGA